MSVETIVDALIGREGGYSDHPADKGGPTMWGVTEQVARAYGYKGAMSALPRETAAAIYRARYWTEPKFDRVAAIYPRVAEEMFDTGVNMGTGVAVQFLQRSLNALNRGATDYPDIVVDRAIGPMTLRALDWFKARRGAAGEDVMLKALDALQGERYITLAERRVANEAFLYGWLASRIGALA